MRRNPSQPPASPGGNSLPDSNDRETAPLSLSRLREAFATMLSPQSEQQQGTGNREHEVRSTEYRVPPAHSWVRSVSLAPAEISPRSVVEAMLFVGRPDNGPLSARELAAAMRGVSPAEIDATVAELNAIYDADAAPYRIDGNHTGYRLVLREDFERMRDKFYGRVREAKLSPAAIEVLSIVAYNEPATLQAINELRGAPSGAALSTLVRRRLLRLERCAEDGGTPQYRTTDRFLQLFGLENLSTLPRSEELEKA